MRTVDLILRKRGGDELSVEEIRFLVNGYTTGEIPDYQMAAFLMATWFSGMTDRELSALTEAMIATGETLNLADIPGVKVDKHSTGGVGDKTSLICAPIAAAAGVVVPMISGRGLGHTGGTLDKLEAIPGFRTDLTIDQFRAQLLQHNLAFMGQSEEIAPADKRLYALRDVTGTVESIPLIASSIMSKKMAEGVDALVLDVKVGHGAFMKKQVDARRLAQAMEVMEVSQTLQKSGPADLTRLSLELAARMIYLGKVTATLDDARKLAEDRLMDGSAYRKFKDVVEAQGGNSQALDRFELLPNASGMREILSPRAGYVSAIMAEDIGRASTMMGAGRSRKEDVIDPAVGVILEVKMGEKVDAGSVLCRLYYTGEENLDEAAELVEDAFRISGSRPDERELILEVVG